MSDRKEEISNFSEEVLGVNLRSFRTVRDLIIRPNKVFQDIQDRKGNYTPTLRIALFVVGLAFAATYFVGGTDQFLLVGVQENGNLYENLVKQYGQEKIDKYFGIVTNILTYTAPFQTILAMAPVIWILKSIKPEATLPLRINYVFGVATISTITSLILFMVYAFSNVSYFTYVWLTFPFPLIASWVTAFRGGQNLFFSKRNDGIMISTLITIIGTVVSFALLILIGFLASIYATKTVFG